MMLICDLDVSSVPAGQPGLDLGMIVGGLIVHDAVDVQLGRRGRVNLVQKRQELLMAMARLATGQHRAIKYVQCGNRVVVPWRL